MSLRFLFASLFLLTTAVGCSAAAGSEEDFESAEQNNTTDPPTQTTVLSSDFGHEDIVLPAAPMARLVIPNTTGSALCNGTAGISILGANESGRLIIDGTKLNPPLADADRDMFQLECLGDMRFDLVTGQPTRPAEDALLLALDLLPDAETLRLEAVDAAGRVLFTADDLSVFVEQVRNQSDPLTPYAELLRQEEILARVLAPTTYIARKYTTTTYERLDFADGHCELGIKVDSNVTLRSPSHFGIELDLSRLASHQESRDANRCAP